MGLASGNKLIFITQILISQRNTNKFNGSRFSAKKEIGFSGEILRQTRGLIFHDMLLERFLIDWKGDGKTGPFTFAAFHAYGAGKRFDQLFGDE
jgi:hypothetical protein